MICLSLHTWFSFSSSTSLSLCWRGARCRIAKARQCLIMLYHRFLFTCFRYNCCFIFGQFLPFFFLSWIQSFSHGNSFTGIQSLFNFAEGLQESSLVRSILHQRTEGKQYSWCRGKPQNNAQKNNEVICERVCLVFIKCHVVSKTNSAESYETKVKALKHCPTTSPTC